MAVNIDKAKNVAVNIDRADIWTNEMPYTPINDIYVYKRITCLNTVDLR